MTPAPPGLGSRGRRLWHDQLAGGKPTPAQQVLIEEACRIVDRLDRLDALLSGEADAWLKFQVDESGTEVTVIVDKPLAEARLQATALKQLLGELRQSWAAGSRAPAPPPAGADRNTDNGAPAAGGDVLDELAKRRARRHADAEGS